MPAPLLATSLPEGPLWTVCRTILKDALAGATDSNQEVIGIVIPVASDGTDWSNQAANILKRYPKCRGLVVAHWKAEQMRKHPKPGLRVPFNKAVRFVTLQGNLLTNLLKEVRNLSRMPPSTDEMSRAAEVVFANELYRRIEAFGHGATKDLTNQVLAPLRIALQQTPKGAGLPPKWKRTALALWRDFFKAVIKESREDWWLSAELRNAFGDLTVARPWSGNARNEIVRLERIMDLLAECRALAGATTVSGNCTSRTVKQLPGTPIRKSWCYEVLVIDDHATAWRPVFKKLQAQLARGIAGERMPVTFDFFTGGEPTAGNRDQLTDLLAKLPDYDAVLLDVYLNGKLDGINILRTIRRHYLNLPIIIWTSSSASELPAKAQFAHGFLFKKSAKIENIASLLTERLREGNAKRRYPLPGHFFDHSIRSRANRKTALRFAEYCSKQLDSFHALDEQYFRFFTDHGGRHLIKLLEYVEDFLRPLIHDKRMFPISDDAESDAEREEEILALYLAVFLHEFGMLRLKGKNEPDWNRRSASEMRRENQLVRNLHALRGMVMIADPECTHWPDEEGQYQAEMRFSSDTGRRLANSVAIITGYHSRLLPIDTASATFCRWTSAVCERFGDKAATMLAKRPGYSEAERGLLSISSRFFNQKRVRSTLTQCRKSFSPERLERLRLHSALFRFADAIDVDHTRNPADFLALSTSVSEIDLREALKRQVIRTVHAEGGAINFFACVPAPNSRLLARVLPGDKIPDVAENPWEGKWSLKRINKVKVLQKMLDDRLAEFWKNPCKAATEMGFTLLKSGRFTAKSKIEIGSLTALSVAWEVADEYDAIVKCDLTSVIRLQRFDWRAECPPMKLQKMLTMLFHPNGLDRFCV